MAQVSTERAEARPAAFPYFVLLGAQLAVGSAAILARTGLNAGLSPIGLAAWRLTVASVILVVWMRLRRPSPEPSGTATPAPIIPLLIAGLLLGLHFATWFASLQTLTVARSTLLVATTPLWAGLADRFILGEAVPIRFWLGLALAGVGVYLLVGAGTYHQGAAGQGAAWQGDMLAVAGAITVAAYLLIAQKIQPKLGSLRMVAWTYSFAAITLWPAALLMTPAAGALPPSQTAWLSIVGMALIPQLIGHTAMNWSLHHFSAAAVSAATLLEPIFAAALACWIFHEPVTAVQAVGGAALLVGVGVSTFRKREKFRRD